MPRPRGDEWLDDELKALQKEGVHVLVSLLTEDEVKELSLQAEPRKAQEHKITFLHFPVPDRGVPTDKAQTNELVHTLLKRLAQDQSVVLHCRQGIGRSSIIAACILAAKGMSVGKAFECLAAVRGVPVPETEAQYRWVTEFIQSAAFRPAA